MLRAEPEDPVELPYDDESANAMAASKPGPSLKDRIGRARVYALEDTSANALGRLAKRKRDVLEDPIEDVGMEEEVMLADPSLRDNAITLTGSPIGHLPTAKIFAYVAHYAPTPPIALEWIDDNTVVLVCKSSKVARITYSKLMRTSGALPNTAEERLAQEVPQPLWPAQMRINQLLSEGEGLAGEIQLRWASTSDVKKRGAASSSTFYKKYGEQAGREGRPAWNNSDGHKRRKGGDGSWTPRESDPLDPVLQPTPMADHSRSDRDGQRRQQSDGSHSRHRPAVTKDDLDAELDAFLNDREP